MRYYSVIYFLLYKCREKANYPSDTSLISFVKGRRVRSALENLAGNIFYGARRLWMAALALHQDPGNSGSLKSLRHRFASWRTCIVAATRHFGYSRAYLKLHVQADADYAIINIKEAGLIRAVEVGAYGRPGYVRNFKSDFGSSTQVLCNRGIERSKRIGIDG